MTLRLCVLASGRGSNMTSLLDKIDAGLVDGRVTLVVSDRPDAECLVTARDRGVPAIVELPRLDAERRGDYDERLRAVVAADAPDLIVLAGFMRILSPRFVDSFAGHIINIHPALLPKHKGAHGIRDTLAAGDPEAGCTTHFVTAELDGGPTILQAALDVRPDDDVDTLAARVLVLEHLLLPRTVQLVAEGRVAADGTVADGPSWKDLVDVPTGSRFDAGF